MVPAVADLWAARTQMASSLGWHIVIACLGVGMPALVLFAEWRGHRTQDADHGLLALLLLPSLWPLFSICQGRAEGPAPAEETAPAGRRLLPQAPDDRR